jgi:hypothetical protein
MLLHPQINHGRLRGETPSGCHLLRCAATAAREAGRNDELVRLKPDSTYEKNRVEKSFSAPPRLCGS